MAAAGLQILDQALEVEGDTDRYNCKQKRSRYHKAAMLKS